MMRKLVIILVSSVICLLGVIPVLAQADYPYVWTSAPDSDYEEVHRWIWATPQDYEKFTGKTIEKYNEAPMLRMKVAAGELPPVEERLPEEPLVVNPYEEIGEYGGVANVSIWSPMGYWEDARMLNNAEALLRPNIGINVEESRPRPNVPNVIKDWELSKDNRALTLYLRKGMKWSDGEPFTADDILFWYEDVLLNEELTPVIGGKWKIGGGVYKLKRIDDYTVRFDFDAPNPFVLYNLATWGPEVMTSLPKHYLKRFHPSYTPKEELEKVIKEEGYGSWTELFEDRGHPSIMPPAPTLLPFVLKERTVAGLFLERNPYYWKVDREGNQLPYFDAIRAKVVANPEVKGAMSIAGEFDFAYNLDVRDYPMYLENAEKGDYRMLMYLFANRAGVTNVSFNLTYKEDLVLGEMFRDKRFRQALSLAADRAEINEFLYYGKGKPTISTMLPVSMFSIEEPYPYIEYDPKKANALLDEMGLKWDKEHKYRLKPDGQKLTILFEVLSGLTEGGDFDATAELLKKYWEAIGIDIQIKVEASELMSNRWQANETQMLLYYGATTTDDNLIMAPNHYVLWRLWCGSAGGYPWIQWYLTDGEMGEKPSEELLEVTKKWERILVTSDEEERIRLGREIFRWNAENVLTISFVGECPGPILAKNNMRNIPPEGLHGVAGTFDMDYYYPEQFYFKHPLSEIQKG